MVNSFNEFCDELLKSGFSMGGGITKETSGQFDRALTNLQKNLFITMCGRRQKVSRTGEPYGWSSTVFTTVEDFWGRDYT